MQYEWDETKNARNKTKHGLGFEALEGFDWSRAVIINRSRHDDGEQRLAGIGPLNGRLFTAIYTWRGDTQRIISLRRANKAEERIYDETI
jgi:uncharacterized protein